MELINARLPPPRGGGYLRKFNAGRLRPEVIPLTLLYYYLFRRKGTPFIYLLLKKVPLSHTHFWKYYHFHVVLDKSADTAIWGIYSKCYNDRPF